MRSKTHKACSMPVVPIDVVVSEILPRLPARTVQLFKCVNKFIYHGISSKDFINRHRRLSFNSDTNHLLIVFTVERDSRQCLYLLDVDSPGFPALYLSLPEPFCDTERSLNVVGSCDGLLCLNSSDVPYRYSNNPMYYAMIVNPSTGNVIANTSLSIPESSRTCSGFAYDGVSDDYKLVVVKYSGELHEMYTKREVMVYSMKFNSWRSAQPVAYTDSMSIPYARATCVLMSNYLMHWFSSDQAGNRTIVCFNGPLMYHCPTLSAGLILQLNLGFSMVACVYLLKITLISSMCGS